jgi:hypothetical protein
MTTPSTNEQEMLTMSYIAYVGMWGEAAQNQTALSGLMNGFMAKLAPVAGKWKTVWGPGVSFGRIHLISNQNVMFVARDQRNPAHLAVVVRGTNPLDLSNIMFEVDDVLDQKAWPSGNPPSGLKPKVAHGVQTGLDILLDMRPVAGVPGIGLTLVDFLKQEAARSDAPLDVVTTGHSLGGSLCAALALRLADIRRDWDPTGKASVSTVPVAGCTPGNSDFAKYFDSSMSGRCTRIHNSLDIVPLMYNFDDMAKIEKIYEPTMHTSGIFKAASKAAVFAMKLGGVEYQQIMRNAPALKGSFYPKTKTFLMQMLSQHVQGYVDLLGLHDQITVQELFEAHV